jgi:hypothetical protein
MNNSCVDEIKKEDKKAFKSFLMIIVISAIAGGIVGFMSGNLKQILGESVPNLLINIFEIITPFASLVLSILVMIVSMIIYTDSRKKYDLWKVTNEDDDTIDKIEVKLSYPILFTSVNTILGFFFFLMGGMLVPFDNVDGGLSHTKGLCFFIGFILCITSSILIQKKIVNLEKEINPLLKGSVYDTKFTEKWLDSCDEAIKLGIFKSAYKAHKSVSKTCIILLLFCMVGYDLWNFGVMPMVMVTIIWLVQTISYCMESIKQSKAR